MIVKGTDDEAELLEQCLANIAPHVDKIYLNINAPKGKKVAKSVIDVAKKHKADYVTTVWTGNFVTARNESFSRVKEDFQIWLDSDDTVDKPEKIRDVIAILSKNQHGIYVKYDYDHDEVGNVTVTHWVARIVRNDGTYEWKSSIADEDVAVHETLNEVVSRPKAMCEDFKVIHHADHNRRLDSLLRNIKLLQGMYEKQEADGKFDPRTLFYLATHYYDADNYPETVRLLRDYLMLSGWPEERCEAHVYLGNIYQMYENTEGAYEEYIRAMGEYQNSPRPYIELSQLAYNMGRYQDSADWIEKCLQLPPPATTMVQRPMESTFKAYMLAAQAYVNVGGKRLDQAKDYIAKALKLRPLDVDAQRSKDMIDELIEKREDIRAAVRITRSLEATDEKRIVPFIDSLPFEIQDNPIILNTRHRYTEPKVWGDNTIAIYVGQGPLGIWGPWSLESGIGGSEEAVIKMSRELSLLGWKVTIYGTPGNRAGLDGDVDWKQYYEFNPRDSYNVLIAWRNPWFFDADIAAKKKYLWLHDVMEKVEFTPDRIAKVDKVIFVGKYHAELYKGIIPEDKWFISGNGIDVQDFELADGVFERQPHKMIYTSAYNRGLKLLLDNWDTILKAVPDATLDIYYGWESYDAINKDNPERMAWKNELVEQINSLHGVTDYGRISHKEIVKVCNEADVFAYPCIFNEVYCISYVKAMAGGAWPVSTNYAELASYKDDGGVQVDYEPGQLETMMPKYIEALIATLLACPTDDERDTMKQKARSKYGWDKTAMGWDGDFKS